MKNKAMLHELIEMAKSGKKFKAKSFDNILCREKDILEATFFLNNFEFIGWV